MNGPDQRKIMRAVLSAVVELPLHQRIAILRTAQQLMLQKLHDREYEEAHQQC
jgi:hypothetical protein